MKKDRWMINPLLSFIFTSIIGVIFAVITWLATSEIWPSIVTGVAGLIFTEFCLMKFGYLPKINETVCRLLRRNPLFIVEVDSLISSMEETKGKYGTVLDFARDVIKEMVSKHFVLVFREPGDYIQNIQKLISSSNMKIEGTCTMRPKLFALAIDVTNPIEQREEINRRHQYLKYILSAKAPYKCRIVILTKEEIINIIKECCEAIESIMDSNDGDKFNDIPEIEWFVTSANGNEYLNVGEPKSDNPRIKLFWAEHTHAIDAIDINKLPKEEYKIGNHHVEEFALFDRQVVIKYLKESSWTKGILFMAWIGIPMIEKYSEPFELLEQSPDRANDNIYSSFFYLVSSLIWDNSDKMTFENPVVQTILNNKLPSEVYKSVLDFLGCGKIKFKDTYKNIWKNI